MADKRKAHILGILLLTVLLRIECIFMPVIDHLESGYSTIVSCVMDGDVMYKDISGLKMPLAYLPIHFVYLIFGRNNLLALHIFSIFWAVLITFIVYKMAKYAYNWRIAVLSAYLFAIFSATLNVSGGGILPKSLTFMSFESEFTFCLPYTLACFMFLKSVRERKNVFTFLTGFFWAISLSVHPKTGTLLFVMVTYLIILVLHPKHPMAWKFAVKQLWYISLSTFVGFLPMVIYLISIKSLAGLLDFYSKASDYAKGINMFTKFAAVRFFKTIFYICIKNNYLLWILAFITIITVVFSIFRNIVRRYKLFSDKDSSYLMSNIFFTLCFLFAFVGIWADAPKFWRQHFGQTFPFLMILAGYSLWLIWNKVEDTKNKILKFTVITIIAMGVLYPIYVNQVKQIGSIKKLRGYLSYPIFEYIKRNTEVNDRIYTWCFFQDIYTLSNRVSATHDPWNTNIMGYSWQTFPPSVVEPDPKQREKFLEKMRRKTPKIIIDPKPVKKENEPRPLYGSFLWAYNFERFPPMQEVPFLWEFVKENYYLKERVDGFTIYWLKSEEDNIDVPRR